MLKWMGAILVVSCSTWLSMGRVFRSRQRVRALNALLDGLSMLRGELHGRAAPLPELLGRLACSVPQPAGALFGMTAEHLTRRELPFPAAWDMALQETETLALLPEERQAMLTLGGVLGRSGLEEQCRELERTEAKLRLFLDLEQKERMKRGQVFAAVGAGTGAMLAILLL